MEIWKDIPGYEGLYQASNLGRVKRISFLHGETKRIIHSEKILKPSINKYGYYNIGLSKNGVKTYRLHRIIMNTFNPTNNTKLQINHIDGNKLNNNIDNLEWCTCKENINHAYKIGLKKGRRNKDNVLSKIVNQYDLNGNFIKQWESTKEIERTLGINNSSISQCCLNKIKKSHNYIWRYQNG